MKNKNFFTKLRIFLFVVLLSAGCVVGFLTFLRPTVSESEGRPLTSFPSFSIKAFLTKSLSSLVSKIIGTNNGQALTVNSHKNFTFVKFLCKNIAFSIRIFFNESMSVSLYIA